MKAARLITAALLAELLLCSCGFLPPAPTDEQILQAAAESNEIQTEPMELGYEEMRVPRRSPGLASGVIGMEDKSIQRNFAVVYDKKAKTFYVEGFITLGLERMVFTGMNSHTGDRL